MDQRQSQWNSGVPLDYLSTPNWYASSNYPSPQPMSSPLLPPLEITNSIGYFDQPSFENFHAAVPNNNNSLQEIHYDSPPINLTPTPRVVERQDHGFQIDPNSSALINEASHELLERLSHNSPPVQCLWVMNGQLCSYMSATQSELEDHLKSAHISRGSKGFVCYWRGCERKLKSFVTQYNLSQHLVSHSNPSTSCSEIDDSMYSNSESLRNHQIIHTEKNELECDECGKSYNNRFNLRRHRHSVHGNNIDKTSHESPEMLRHCSAPVQCSWEINGQLCTYTTPALSELEAHMNSAHIESGSKDYVCHWRGCERKLRPFVAKYKFNKHLARHTHPGAFPCELCDSTYSSLESLKRHQLVHKDLIELQCEECGKRFRGKFEVKRHKNEVHGFIKRERGKPSSNPSQDTNSMGHLSLLAAPSSSPPAQCLWEINGQLCAYVPHEPNDLRAHMKSAHIRKGSKDLVCHWRGCTRRLKAFTSRFFFNIHLTSHTNPGAFSCEMCDLSFSHHELLRKHQLKHTGVRELQCEECGKRFKGGYKLRAHKYTMHGIKGMELQNTTLVKQLQEPRYSGHMYRNDQPILNGFAPSGSVNYPDPQLIPDFNVPSIAGSPPMVHLENLNRRYPEISNNLNNIFNGPQQESQESLGCYLTDVQNIPLTITNTAPPIFSRHEPTVPLSRQEYSPIRINASPSEPFSSQQPGLVSTRAPVTHRITSPEMPRVVEQSHQNHQNSRDRESIASAQCLWEINGQICAYISRDPYDLETHMKTLHSGGFVCYWRGCERGLKPFSLRCNFSDHITGHSNREAFRCVTCGFIFSGSRSLNKHQLLHTERFQCEQCGKLFKRNDELIMHKNVHRGQTSKTIGANPTTSDNISFTCDYPGCGRTFRYKLTMTNHKKTQHTGATDNFKCEKCDKSYASRKSLNRHMKETHKCLEPPAPPPINTISKKGAQCLWTNDDGEMCKGQFSDIDSLEKHIKAFHLGNTKHICRWRGCSLMLNPLSARKHLLKHIKLHILPKLFACPHKSCKEVFTEKSEGTKHFEGHVDKKSHKCLVPNCGKAFVHIRSLWKHERKEHGHKELDVDDEESNDEMSSGRSTSESSTSSTDIDSFIDTYLGPSEPFATWV